MKAKLLLLFSLLVLLLVSTLVLADGRPTGIRIGRAVSGGGAAVEVDVTITGTDFFYSEWATSYVWIDNRPGWANTGAWQYASNNFSEQLPWAIEWGDGYYFNSAILFGPSGGPYQGTFSHTYLVPGTYTVVAGDFVCDTDCKTFDTTPPVINTGNPIYGRRYMQATFGTDTFSTSPVVLAITNTATVTTGTGIPALNVYGLLALSLVLVGTGILVYRNPQRTLA